MVPLEWYERFPEGSRLKAWLLSWREVEERTAREMERGPLGTRTPGETEEPKP